MTTIDVDEIMAGNGFQATRAGGGNWLWAKPVGDGTTLCVCTIEGATEGDPSADEWYIGRHAGDGDGCFAECNEGLTLADALVLVDRLPAPTVPGTRLSREEIEALG